MSLVTQATVADVVSEFKGTGTGPYTLFNVSNVTSGQIYDKITQANAMLQNFTGQGGAASPNALVTEGIKRFEVAMGSAYLASDLAGIIITDGFNVTTGGIAIQRQSAQQQAYTSFIKDHLALAQWWIRALHPWFFPGSPDSPQGTDEYGNPVGYWRVSPSRY